MRTIVYKAALAMCALLMACGGGGGLRQGAVSDACVETCIDKLAAVPYEPHAATTCARVYTECHRTLVDESGPIPKDACEATVDGLDRFAAGYLARARCAEIGDVRQLSNEAVCDAMCSAAKEVELACVVALPDDAFHAQKTPCGLPAPR